MSSGGNVLGGGKCPGGKCPGGNALGEMPGGKCPGGKRPGGKRPGGKRPGGKSHRIVWIMFDCGGRFPPRFIHQVIIITGLNKLYNCMFSP